MGLEKQNCLNFKIIKKLLKNENLIKNNAIKLFKILILNIKNNF